MTSLIKSIKHNKGDLTINFTESALPGKSNLKFSIYSLTDDSLVETIDIHTNTPDNLVSFETRIEDYSHNTIALLLNDFTEKLASQYGEKANSKTGDYWASKLRDDWLLIIDDQSYEAKSKSDWPTDDDWSFHELTPEYTPGEDLSGTKNILLSPKKGIEKLVIKPNTSLSSDTDYYLQLKQGDLKLQNSGEVISEQKLTFSGTSAESNLKPEQEQEPEQENENQYLDCAGVIDGDSFINGSGKCISGENANIEDPVEDDNIEDSEEDTKGKTTASNIFPNLNQKKIVSLEVVEEKNSMQTLVTKIQGAVKSSLDINLRDLTNYTNKLVEIITKGATIKPSEDSIRTKIENNIILEDGELRKSTIDFSDGNRKDIIEVSGKSTITNTDFLLGKGADEVIIGAETILNRMTNIDLGKDKNKDLITFEGSGNHSVIIKNFGRQDRLTIDGREYDIKDFVVSDHIKKLDKKDKKIHNSLGEHLHLKDTTRNSKVTTDGIYIMPQKKSGSSKEEITTPKEFELSSTTVQMRITNDTGFPLTIKSLDPLVEFGRPSNVSGWGNAVVRDKGKRLVVTAGGTRIYGERIGGRERIKRKDIPEGTFQVPVKLWAGINKSKIQASFYACQADTSQGSLNERPALGSVQKYNYSVEGGGSGIVDVIYGCDDHIGIGMNDASTTTAIQWIS